MKGRRVHPSDPTRPGDVVDVVVLLLLSKAAQIDTRQDGHNGGKSPTKQAAAAKMHASFTRAVALQHIGVLR